ESEVLAIALVVAEEKKLVAADGAAERTAELIALKFGGGTDVEVIARVESAVAKKFIRVAVDVVCAGHGDDADLRSSALAVVCSVGIGDDVEFAHGIHAEKLTAGASGCDVDKRCSGVFNAVQEEEIVLRAAAGDGKHVAHRRVGCAGTAGALGGVVDGGGIQGEKLVVTAAIEGQLFDLALVDNAGGFLR